MRRILAVAFLACLIAVALKGRGVPARATLDLANLRVPPFHFQPEFTFDSPSDPQKWSVQPKGLNVSFATTDQAYFRSEVPDLPQQSQSWEASGWKGERLNAEVVVWSPDTVHQIRVAVSDLVDANGAALPSANVHVSLVRYVVSNYPYGANEVSCGATDSNPPYLMPDRLQALERFDLAANSVRPIWLSLDIPAGTTPGVYRGTVDVTSEKGRATLRVAITVQDPTLPPPGDL